MKTVVHARTWKMDICVHANLDLLDLNVKQVIAKYHNDRVREIIFLICEVIDLSTT